MTIEDIALQMTKGLGPKGVAHLLQHFDDARAIFAATADTLTGIAQLRPDLADRIVRRQGFGDAERELAFCRRHAIRPVASTDPEYPELLHEIPDYPHVIYTQGNLSALSRRCLSIVGTRSMTSYGQAQCTRLIGELAERIPDLCIVSGLEFGINSAVHHTALSAHVPSIAVLPAPLPKIVPAQLTNLAREIVEKGGLLLTEASSRPPRSPGYSARNRLIAGMSMGCVVIEAPEDSGTLSIANFANDYDRLTMAVPGRTTDEHSRGTNRLIHDGKARLVEKAEDILLDFVDLFPARLSGLAPLPPSVVEARLDKPREAPKKEPARPASPKRELIPANQQKTRFTDDELAVLAAAAGSPLTADEIVERTQIPARRVLSALTMLQVQGVLEEQQGRRFYSLVELES